MLQRPSERIGAVLRALLPAPGIAGTIARLVAIALLHRFGETLGAFAQRVERAALRPHGAIGVTFAEPARGIAHRAIGLLKPILAVALIATRLALTRLALFAALTFIAALVRPHAALGEFVLQFLQALAQALLVLLQVAHVLLALLAALAVAP